MIIQKAGLFKFLRYVGIFCAITMGFMTIVATSEEDAEEAASDLAGDLGVEIDLPEQEVEMELDPVEVEKTSTDVGSASANKSLVTIQADGDEKGRTSVNEGLEQAIRDADITVAGFDGPLTLDDISDPSIRLDFVSAWYTATWTRKEGVAETGSIECRVTITGEKTEDPDPTTFWEEAEINTPATLTATSKTHLGNVSDPAKLAVINHYLQNRDNYFQYAAKCDDAVGIDSYTVTFDISVGLFVSGKISGD